MSLIHFERFFSSTFRELLHKVYIDRVTMQSFIVCPLSNEQANELKRIKLSIERS